MNRERRYFGATVAGLLLIALGAVWVMHNLEMFDFHLRQWWPVILIVIGLVHMANSRRLTEPGAWIMILLGGVFLLTANHFVEWDEIWKYWPVVLIVIGLSIVFKRHGGRRRHVPPDEGEDIEMDASGEGIIRGSAIFGGVERRIADKNITGGTVSAVFGGAEIDLRSAGLSEKGAVLDVSVIFGGAEIFVPETWALELRPSVILGGVSNKASNPEKSTGPRLVIKASAIFGGVDIKN